MLTNCNWLSGMTTDFSIVYKPKMGNLKLMLIYSVAVVFVILIKVFINTTEHGKTGLIVLCLCCILKHHQHNKLYSVVSVLEFQLLCYLKMLSRGMILVLQTKTVYLENNSAVEAPLLEPMYIGGNLTNTASSNHAVGLHTSCFIGMVFDF